LRDEWETSNLSIFDNENGFAGGCGYCCQ
jgi:hypothetical protein